jgi:hypothetical protein
VCNRNKIVWKTEMRPCNSITALSSGQRIYCHLARAIAIRVRWPRHRLGKLAIVLLTPKQRLACISTPANLSEHDIAHYYTFSGDDSSDDNGSAKPNTTSDAKNILTQEKPGSKNTRRRPGTQGSHHGWMRTLINHQKEHLSRPLVLCETP